MKRSVLALLAAGLVCALPVASSWGAQNALADAQLDYNAGHYTRTVDALSEALAKSPDDAAMQFLLGKSFYQLSEFPKAITALEHAVQLAPSDADYHDWLGKAYGRKAEETSFLGAMGWARKTHKEFETAVQDDPHNFEAQRNLIRYEMNAPGMVGGGDEKALKHIQDLQQIDALQGQLAEGEYLATKHRTAEADAVYAKVLDSHSDRMGTYLEVADYFIDRQNAGNLARAVAAAERIDPNDRRLKFYKGILLVLQGTNPTEAETLLKSFIATVPINSDLPPHSGARDWLGKLYEAEGKYSEAADQYRRALNLDPHDKAAEDALKRVQSK